MNHNTIEELVADLAAKGMCNSALLWVADQTTVEGAWKDVNLEWRLRAMRFGFDDGQLDCPWSQLSKKQFLFLMISGEGYIDQAGWENLTGKEKAILQACHGENCGDSNGITPRDRRRAGRFLAANNVYPQPAT